MKSLVLSCLESRVESNRSIYARFVLAPFERGDALTVGTSLRRALLSQADGVAITALDIQGITHEFCTIVGVRESVLELSLNFQQIVLRSQVNSKTAQVGYLQVQGPAVVCANDLKLPVGVECVDPTQHVATLARDGLLVVKFLVGGIRLQPPATPFLGRAEGTELNTSRNTLTAEHIREAQKLLRKDQFKQVESQKGNNVPPLTQLKSAQKLFQSDACLQNIIPLEPLCTTVNRANFTVQVDDLTNRACERLVLEVWTNGSVHPRQAIQSAVLSLVTLFSELRKLVHLDSYFLGIKGGATNQTQTALSKRVSFLYKSNLDKMSLLSSDLSNLSLSLKTYTFLKQKGIHKLTNLLNLSSKGILQLVNGNKNMFYDIKRCVFALGLQLNEPTH